MLAGNGTVWNNFAGGIVDLEASGSVTPLDYNGNGRRPLFVNAGTFRNAIGARPNLNWSFVNQGQLWVRSNGVAFLGGLTQTAGTCVVDAGATLMVAPSETVLIEGGVLSGEGTILGNVVNAGTIHPGSSVGILRISGNVYTNLPGGTLAIEIGGQTAGPGYSQLAGVTSATEAVLGGALSVSFANGFLPSLGDTFTIMTFPIVAPQTTFASLNGLRAGNGLVLAPVYTPSSVNLVAVNEPVLTTVAHNGSQFTFSLSTTLGVSYTVEYSDSLSPPAWQILTTIVGNGAVESFIDPGTGTNQRFYRVRFQ